MVGGVLGRTLTSLALLCATLAWTGWVYLHTIGDPHRIEAMATAVLHDSGARAQIAHAITDQLMSIAGMDPGQQSLVEAAVDVSLSDPRIAENVISALGSAHANALGVNDSRPTIINTSALLAATRDHLAVVAPEIAALLPDGAAADITLPKYHPPGAGTLRSLALPATTLFATVGALLLGAAFVLGERRRTLRRVGTWAVLQGIGWLVVPKLIVAAARQWAPNYADIIAVVARVSARSIAPAAAALVIGGLVALVVWIVPAWWPAEGGAAPASAGVGATRPWSPQPIWGARRYGMATRPDANVVSRPPVRAGPVGPVGPVDTFVRSSDNTFVASVYPDLPGPAMGAAGAAVDDGDPWRHFFGTETG
jgi:hypothetical protein